MTRRTLALDFGTSSTYVALCPEDRLQSTLVEWGNGQAGMETALLCRNGVDHIGGSAVEAFSMLSAAERKKVDFRSKFKPLIQDDPQAFESAVRFLSALRRRLTDANLNLDQVELCVGFPCDSRLGYTQKLEQALCQSGWGEAKFLEEPLAAFVAALGLGDLPSSAAFQNGLVLDFGGGTFDLAMVRGFEAQPVAGDWRYGGRVFDDLFFQLLKNNRTRPYSAHDLPFVRRYWSRVLKEQFSQAMSVDPRSPWVGSAGRYGVVSLSWDQFLQAAAHYVPSEELRVEDGDPLGNDGEIDLLQHFRDLCSQNFDHEPDWILCSGGSSAWAFVSCELRKIFPRARLVGLSNPGGAVARGLALLPALRKQSKQRRQLLDQQRDSLVEQLVFSDLLDLTQESFDRLVEPLAALISQQVVRPALGQWVDQCAPLEELEAILRSHLDELVPQIQELQSSETTFWRENAVMLLKESLEQWFDQQGFSVDSDNFEIHSASELKVFEVFEEKWSSRIFEILTSMTKKFLWILGGIVGGGAGLLLGLPFAAAGSGLLVGLSAGLGAAWLLGSKGLDSVKDRIKLPEFMAHRIRSKMDSIVQQTQKSLEKQLQSEFEELWQQEQQTLCHSLHQLFDRESSALQMVQNLEAKKN